MKNELIQLLNKEFTHGLVGFLVEFSTSELKKLNEAKNREELIDMMLEIYENKKSELKREENQFRFKPSKNCK